MSSSQKRLAPASSPSDQPEFSQQDPAERPLRRRRNVTVACLECRRLRKKVRMPQQVVGATPSGLTGPFRHSATLALHRVAIARLLEWSASSM